MLTLVLHSENMNNNEFLPGRYTDLTFEAESGSIHSAPNRESQDFFRGFKGIMVWSILKGVFMLHSSEICVVSG